MAITIYTYSNPYKIDREPYWASIKNCFHLCVSQTLVNGLCDQYSEFYKGKITTINNFINALYENWESDVTAISQLATIDNVIEYFDFSSVIDDIKLEDIINSLKRNRNSVFKSIRTLFELGMEPDSIKIQELSYEQNAVVEIYKELNRTKNEKFALKNDISKEEIDKAILMTVNNVIDDAKKNEIVQIRNDSVVIHGIHQFSPIMLRTIEAISQYKLVVILFNYQPDYRSVYQTWLDIYSAFESKVVISPKNLNNDGQRFAGSKVADSIAALIGGNTSAIDFSDKIEVTEYDNSTEFAGYVAKIFEEAERARKENGYAHPTLYYMTEQFYAANSSVNSILKLYFPEQFGERNFLDYPIGHFFLSITNMWNPETHTLHINDLQDLLECLSCGIIAGDTNGELVSSFEKSKLFFSKETTIKRIIRRLKLLRKKIEELDDVPQENTEIFRIEYFDLSVVEIDHLVRALYDLDEIIKYFYADFSEQKNDFNKFYKKISDVLITRVLDVQEIDDEFKDIVQRLLIRLNEVNIAEANASFECLRETMQLYLHQIPKDGAGANWIVRNFEQIDGDVLRNNSCKQKKIYHFACISDDDMSITHKDEFPWPLDINFFEVAQAPIDWKYRVFVVSRLEYKNFRRYALIYGLLYSKCSIKLSYIKNKDNKKSELYYLLKLLNAKIKPYEPEIKNSFKKNAEYIKLKNFETESYSQYDLMKYRLCRYRFLLESVIEGRSVYKDEFLLRKYLRTILEHRARWYFSGKTYVKNIVFNYLNEQMDELSEIFVFVNHADAIDIVRSSLDYIEKYAVYYGKFAKINDKEADHMIMRENFLTTKEYNGPGSKIKEVLKYSSQAEVDNALKNEALNNEKFKTTLNVLCENCSEKDICLEIYKIKTKYKGDTQ